MIILMTVTAVAACVSAFFWRKSARNWQDMYHDEARKLYYLTSGEIHVFVRKIGYRQYEVSDDVGGPVGKGKTPRTAFKAWVDGRGDDYDFYTSRWLIHSLRETA